MSTRSVIVRLEAEVSKYVAGMAAAGKSTEQAKKTQEQLGESVMKQSKALSTLAPAVTVAGGAMTLAFGKMVKTYADFDKSMSRVQAATHESAENMDLLREAAIAAGSDTAFSAGEAAGAIEELAKAGVSTADILDGGLAGALSLAAAGELEVGKAAEIAASALTQFKLEGNQVVHVADLLAAGAGKAQGSVEDLGAALNQSGLVAASTGLTIEETTGALAAFASAGLTGSDAGTSFKTMLQSLNPNSDKAAALMDDLGISAYDAQGQFVGMSEYAGILQGALKDMSDEQRNATLKTIFGSDAVRAATVLYEQGADGVQKWEDAVNDAGFAAETAAIMQDNLAGDLEKLGGAFDTVFLQSGSGANDALRLLVQTAEGFVDLLGQIPGPVLATVGVITGLAGGAALLGGAFITAVPKIKETKDALEVFVPAGSKADRTIRGLGKAAGIATGAFAALAVAGNLAQTWKEGGEGAEAYAQKILDAANNGRDLNEVFTADTFGNIQAWGVEPMQDFGDVINGVVNTDFGDTVNDWVHSLTGMESEVHQQRAAVADFDGALKQLATGGNMQAAADGFRKAAEAAKEQGIEVSTTAQHFPEYIGHLQATASQLGVNVSEQDLLNWAMTGTKPAAITAAEGASALDEELAEVGVTTEGLVSDMETFLDLLFQTGVLTMSSRDAQAAYEEQLDAVDGALKEITDSGGKMGATLNKNKTDFDLTTGAGRLANDTFQSLAKGGMDQVRAMAEEGVGQDTLQAKLSGTYQDLVTVGKRFGLTAGDAENLARKVLGVPDGVSIDSWMSSAARAEAERTEAAVRRVDGMVATITQRKVTIFETKGSAPPAVSNLGGNKAAWATGGRLPGYDGGGQLPRTGLGTDQILGVSMHTGAPVAWLDDEEWVINGRNSRRYNRELAAINAGTFPKLPGYAAGGEMGSVPYTAGTMTSASAAAPVQPVVFPDRLTLDAGGELVFARIVDRGVRSTTRGRKSIF